MKPTKEKIDTAGFDALIRALKKNSARVQVGIVGGSVRENVNHPGSTDSGVTNAEVGAAHEYGTSTLPQRSFLRIPLADNLMRELVKSGAFQKDSLNAVIRQRSFMPWLQKLAVVGESIVLGAFDTGGYGKWIPSDMSRKKNHQTLIETGQLRNSISTRIVGKDNA